MGTYLNRRVITVAGVALLCTLLMWSVGFGFGNETMFSRMLGGATFLGSEVYLGTWVGFILFIPIGIGIPYLVVRFLFGEDIRDYGASFGDHRQGVIWMLALIPAYVLLSLASAAIGTEEYYTYLVNPEFLKPIRIAIHVCSYLAFALGFESLFRGFVLFGLNKGLGDTRTSRWVASIVSGALSAVALVGHPWVFPAAALIISVPAGFLNLRMRSFLYFAFVHWNLGVWSDMWEIIKLNVAHGMV